MEYQGDDVILPKTNPNSPYYSAVPTLSQPTEVLSRRFELWRQIIKSLVNYFKAASVATNQFSIINNNIVDTISFPFFTSLHKSNNRGDVHMIKEPLVENQKKQSFFAPFGSGSIQDVQILLKKYHLNLAQQQIKMVHELQTQIIPRLEELQKDLLSKIREIKQLNGDFKNNLKEEIAISGQCLDDYLTIVRKLDKGVEDDVTSKNDPFMLRLKLELQLKQQLNQENYLEEAFINLQMTGLELEKIVFQEVQEALNKYSELVSQEIFVMYNDLINELHEGIISKKGFFEWDDFITRDSGKNFLKLTHDQEIPTPRKISTIHYPYNKSIISKSIRSGSFLKKSKILKNYSKSFFILTLNYLHEFKSSNLLENLTPLNSIKLNDCILTESTDSKFQIHVKAPHSIKGHNYVFKIIRDEMSEHDFKKWIMDLKSLTSFNSFQERRSFVTRKICQSGYNSGSGSTAGTPRLEVPNPLDDMNDVTKKLQELQSSLTEPRLGAGTPYTHDNGSYNHIIPTTASGQGMNTLSTQGAMPSVMTSPGAKSARETPISKPHENIIPRAASPVNQPYSPQSIRSTSDNSRKPLTLNTTSVPKVEIQEPTPIQTHRPAIVLTAGDTPPKHGIHNNTGDDGGDYFSQPITSSSASSIHSFDHVPNRAATPAIGNIADQHNHRHIDLNQPLYTLDDGSGTNDQQTSGVGTSTGAGADDEELERVIDAIRPLAN